MRILVANKFYYLHGGCERYLFELIRLLESNGHAVVPFAMRHPKNETSEFDPYFVSYVDFGARLSLRTVPNALRVAGRMFYSFEARRNVEALIRETRPDVMHVRNIYHQLSPSILVAAKRLGVPTVMTVADYNLICPTYKLLRRGEMCEACKGGKFYHAAVYRCVGEQLLPSLIAAAVAYYDRFTQVYERNLDVLVVPSNYMRDKMVQHGWDPSRIVHIPHYEDVSRLAPSFEPGSYAVSFGRLSHEKGLDTLIRAIARVPDLPLYIAGEGPMLGTLTRLVSELGLTNVHFVGFLSGRDLWNLVRGAAFAVVPSQWPEVFGLTILEAFALGKPVVASNVGGIPELVVPEKTGVLVPPCDATALADAMRWMLADRERIAEMGGHARRMAEDLTANHLERVLNVYRSLLS